MGDIILVIYYIWIISFLSMFMSAIKIQHHSSRNNMKKQLMYAVAEQK